MASPETGHTSLVYVMRQAVLSPAILLAATTVWIYLVAAQYARGYFRHYNAELSWFDPSLFRLLTFSFPGLLGGSAVIAAMVAMILLSRASRAVYIAAAIVYLCLFGSAVILLAWDTFVRSDSLPLAFFTASLETWVWGILPFAARAGYKSDSAKHQVQKEQWNSNIAALERAKLELQLRAQPPTPGTLEQIDTELRRARSAFEHRRPVVGVHLALVVMGALLFLATSWRVGDIFAAKDIVRFRVELESMSADRRMVFTDGRAVLFYVREAETDFAQFVLAPETANITARFFRPTDRSTSDRRVKVPTDAVATPHDVAPRPERRLERDSRVLQDPAPSESSEHEEDCPNANGQPTDSPDAGSERSPAQGLLP